MSIRTSSIMAAERTRLEDSPERFLGILGHDLRNPLSALLAAAELLSSGDLSERQARYVARIQASGERMNRMINVLLDFTRSRCGDGIPIARAAVDLNEICNHVVEEMRLAHPDRAPRFRAVGDLRGLWDGDRIAQAVSNLLANAVQHGEPPIHLSVRADESAIALEVSNAGAAIAAHELPSLFEPFQRGKGAAKGLGLGLFITREIVHAHGGTIDARSDDGATVFAIRLPR